VFVEKSAHQKSFLSVIRASSRGKKENTKEEQGKIGGGVTGVALGRTKRILNKPKKDGEKQAESQKAATGKRDSTKKARASDFGMACSAALDYEQGKQRNSRRGSKKDES